jgi:hypothetical protein
MMGALVVSTAVFSRNRPSRETAYGAPHVSEKFTTVTHDYFRIGYVDACRVAT